MIGKDNLISFLGEVDSHLPRKIRIVAIGGTAMTLLGLKPSTIDIDFEMTSEDTAEFRKAERMFAHGIKKIDIFSDGLIFSQLLPDDHSENAIPVKIKFDRIGLFALHPLDIVVTKIGRLNERDKQDIESCIREYKLTSKDVKERAAQIEYTGREENYRMNLKFVLDTMF
jgi:hypothetical protein